MQKKLLYVLLFSFAWAFQIIISKIAFMRGANVVVFSVVSMFIACFSLFLISHKKITQQLKILPPKTIWTLIFANGIHTGIGSIIANVGIQYTTAINAGFLVQLTIITTPITAYYLVREKITKKIVFSILLVIFSSLYSCIEIVTTLLYLRE